MAIQLKRCTEEERVSSNTTLLPGQPLYTVDANKLYINDGDGKPVKELQSLRVDTNRLDSSFRYNGEDVVFSDGTKGSQNGDHIPTADAIGQGSAAFGGLRYDYFTSTATHEFNKTKDPSATLNWGRTPTSAEGPQSLAWGGSSHAYGAWSMAGGKDAKAYQGGSILLGAGRAGLSEANIKSTYMIQVSNSDTYIAKYQFISNVLYEAVEDLVTDTNVSYKAPDGSLIGPFTISEHPELLVPIDELGAPVTYEANRFCFAGNTATSAGYSSASFNSGKSIGRLSFAANSATVQGAYSAGFGQNNTITVTAPNAFVAGATNTVEFDKSSALGYNLKTTRDCQTVVGKYNKYTTNTDDLFQVGGGNNDSIRYNFFGVRGDGRAYVYKAPSESSDVVRLQELSNLNTTLTTEVNKKLNKVSTTYTQAGIGSADFRMYAVHPNGSQVLRTAPGAGRVYEGKNNYTQCLPMYLGIQDSTDTTKWQNAIIVDTPLTGSYTTKYATNRQYVDTADSAILTSAKNYTYSKSDIDSKDAYILTSAKAYTYSQSAIDNKLNTSYYLNHNNTITSSTNFNTILSKGAWAITKTDVASTCTNIPEKMAGLLEVSSPTTNNFTSASSFCYRTQRYTTIQGNVYTRVETISETDGLNTGWSAWRKEVSSSANGDIHASGAVYSYSDNRLVSSCRDLATNGVYCGYSTTTSSSIALPIQRGGTNIKPNDGYTYIAFREVAAMGWFSGGMGSEVTLLTLHPQDIIVPLAPGTYTRKAVGYSPIESKYYEKTLTITIKWDSTNSKYTYNVWTTVTEGTDNYTSYSGVRATIWLFN